MTRSVPHAGLPALSVVVPAFDEGPHVRENLLEVARTLDALGRSFELLLVDDGSRDATAAEAEAAAREDPRVRVLRHDRNRGKGAALATGCAAARGDVLVFLDADLEIRPSEIGPLLARMESAGADVAVASKYLPGSAVRRPLHRLLLSRLYLAATSVLFRLPIRDTQTGLKAMRREVARSVVPAIRTERYAWDIELLVLAHRLGARIVSGPVAVDFLDRGVRIGWRGFLDSGLDTALLFLRDRGLAAYGRALRAARGGPAPRARETLVLASGDDLGLSPSTDRGLLAALAAGRLRSVSVLVEGATSREAAAALRALSEESGASPDVGVHLDLARGRLARFLARAALGLVPFAAVRAEVRRQVEAARALGLLPSHVDAHRHAFLVPAVYRAVAAEARALGLAGIRRPVPLGSVRCGVGLAGLAKGALLGFAGCFARGVPRALGLCAPDGIVDAAVARRWVERGRLPAGVRGRSVEIVAHPGEGPEDLPAPERGVDRAADATALAGLLGGLEALGASARAFSDLPLARRKA